jgi:CheY-like chemotaxis protein
MDEVIDACHRGKDLVRQILTFSRKVEVERKPVKIQPILNEAIRFMRASLPSTIEIRQKIDPECGIVMANPTQIHQIVMNLCSNAYHSMRASGGTLEVTLEEVKIDPNLQRLCQALKDGSYLRLTVRDTGHGIEKSNLERIFDPFFTTKPPGEGSGMGLSTVHGIVKAHEGEITVESEIGKGTVFHIYLPCLGHEITTKEFKPEPIPKGQERILFVDDEPSLVNTAKIILERYGYQVTAVTNALEALEIFHRNPDEFDLVITDQTLPAMTGANLAGQLRLIRPTIPVILTSGYSEVITPEKAREIGICEYIMKPFFARDLAKAIRRVLDQE